ncbi:MAG: hypothetical protein IKR81_11805, partial [Victivallales bacterium]|nr:hypothetical protein [Victivallales bacterium]
MLPPPLQFSPLPLDGSLVLEQAFLEAFCLRGGFLQPLFAAGHEPQCGPPLILPACADALCQVMVVSVTA